jgi:hypothetical protein
MTLMNDWKPFTRFVQQGMPEAAYASGAFTVIAAGPARLKGLTDTVRGGVNPSNPLGGSEVFFPIGMVQNFSLSHNRQFNQIFELGSHRSYFVSGRTTGQLSLGRVLYHGPSILRAMYHSFQDPEGPVVIPSADTTQTASVAGDHNVKIKPGFNNLYMNLASDMFSQPIGLLIKMLDSNENTIGAMYAESCYIPSHSMSVESQGLLVQEQVTIQFERIVPVNINSVPLITGIGVGPEASYTNAVASPRES